MVEYIALGCASVFGSVFGIGLVSIHKSIYLAMARSAARKAVEQHLGHINDDKTERAA